MRRSFLKSDFSNSDFEEKEESDPRVGLVNLADVMLVFACGLMLALVSYWNLDVSAMNEIAKGEDMKEVRDLEEFTDNGSGGGGFVEKGIVYQDPMTGKYYMLEKNGDSEGNKTEDAVDEEASEKD